MLATVPRSLFHAADGAAKRTHRQPHVSTTSKSSANKWSCGPAHCENSEVLPAGSVAVEVMSALSGAGNESGPKLASPLTSVVTSVVPRKFWPSPYPVASHVALAKNSRRKVVFGVLLSVPEIVAVPFDTTALVMTG